MENATIKTHPKYFDWVTITQVDKYFSTVDDIHIKKEDINKFINRLIEVKDEDSL